VERDIICAITGLRCAACTRRSYVCRGSQRGAAAFPHRPDRRAVVVLAADWDGSAYIVWRDLRNTATGPDIYFALLPSPELLRLYLPLLVKEG